MEGGELILLHHLNPHLILKEHSGVRAVFTLHSTNSVSQSGWIVVSPEQLKLRRKVQAPRLSAARNSSEQHALCILYY